MIDFDDPRIEDTPEYHEQFPDWHPPMVTLPESWGMTVPQINAHAARIRSVRIEMLDSLSALDGAA